MTEKAGCSRCIRFSSVRLPAVGLGTNTSDIVAGADGSRRDGPTIQLAFPRACDCTTEAFPGPSGGSRPLQARSLRTWFDVDDGVNIFNDVSRSNSIKDTLCRLQTLGMRTFGNH